jgi:hypothetical protein
VQAVATVLGLLCIGSLFGLVGGPVAGIGSGVFFAGVLFFVPAKIEHERGRSSHAS